MHSIRFDAEEWSRSALYEEDWRGVECAENGVEFISPACDDACVLERGHHGGNSSRASGKISCLQCRRQEHSRRGAVGVVALSV